MASRATSSTVPQRHRIANGDLSAPDTYRVAVFECGSLLEKFRLDSGHWVSLASGGRILQDGMSMQGWTFVSDQESPESNSPATASEDVVNLSTSMGP